MGFESRSTVAIGGATGITSISIANANGFSGTSSGGLNPILTLQLQYASATQGGQLSAADWTTFNNKGPGLSGLTTNFIPIATSSSTIGDGPLSLKSGGVYNINSYCSSDEMTALSIDDDNAVFISYNPIAEKNSSLAVSGGSGILLEYANQVVGQPISSIGRISIFQGELNIAHLIKINLDAPDINLPKGDANSLLFINADKNIRYSTGTGFVKSTAGVITYDNTTYYPASNPNGYTSNGGIVNTISIANANGFSGTSSGGATPVLTINLQDANGSQSGKLTSTDWNIFNNKQNQLNGTGFVKASGTTITYDNNAYYLASNPNGYTNNTGIVNTISIANANGFTGSSSGGANPALTINLQHASAVQDGQLKSSDWLIFYSKQDKLNGVGFVKASGGIISYDNTVYYPMSNPNGYTNNTGTLTNVSIANANGFTGSSSGGSSPVLTILQQNASALQNGQLTSANFIIFSNKQNKLVAGANITIDETNPLAPVINSIGGGSGTVTSISIANINGFSGTSSGGATPVLTINLQDATNSQSGKLTSTDWNIFNNKQNQLNGTGFVKASGTTISYDNTVYYPASNPSGYTSVVKNNVTEINAGVDDLKFTTALGLNGSGYQRSSALTATYIPYSVDGKLQSNSPLYVNGSDVVLSTKIKSISGNIYLQINNSAGAMAASSGANYSGLTYDPTVLQNYVGNGTNTSTISLYPNEIQIDSNQIIHNKGIANTILSLSGTKRVAYNAGVGYLKMDGAGVITFDASIGITETTIEYTDAWSTQTLPSVRVLNYYVNASDSTAKTIIIPTGLLNDVIVINDYKQDCTTNIITLSGAIGGGTSYPMNRNGMSITLKKSADRWNII